jgi:hypothetical protein
MSSVEYRQFIFRQEFAQLLRGPHALLQYQDVVAMFKICNTRIMR